MTTKRYCEGPDDTDCIVRDGGSVRVRTIAMDGCGCGCTPARDPEREAADQKQITAAKAHHDAVNRWADYYTGLRDGRDHLERRDDNGYAEYRDRLADAWKSPALIGA